MAKSKQANTGLYAALGLAALALVGAVVGMRFMSTPPPAPPPPPPPPAERSVTQILRYTEGYYHAILDEDAKRFGITPVPLDDLALPLRRSVELSTPRFIRVGETIETAHLKIGASVLKEWATSGSGQGFRFEHLVLTITNRSAQPLAYRVDTSVNHPEKCRSKGAISHDAIALAAGERIQRTECLWHPRETLRLDRVEVIELSTIGYFYVSRLDPSQIGLDPRVVAGHTPRKAKQCAFVPRREIEASGAGWADVIDFYARHSCDEYTFFGSYRFRTDVEPLPARATSPQAVTPDAGAAPAPR